MGFKKGVFNIPIQRERDVLKFFGELKTFPWFLQTGKIEAHWKMFYGASIVESRRIATRAWLDDIKNKIRNIDNLSDNVWEISKKVNRREAYIEASEEAHAIAQIGVLNVAGQAASDASSDASRDAMLYAELLLIQDIPGVKEYMPYARKRLQVWKHGYGLFRTENETFYVYGIKK